MRYDPNRGSFKFNEEDESWREFAACKGEPTEFWFPPKGGVSHELRTAVAICAECEVQRECGLYAKKHNIEDGIWGGLSSVRRRYL